MSATYLAPVAALLYLLATGLQLLHISQRRRQIDRTVFGLSLAALLVSTFLLSLFTFSAISL